MIFFEFHGEGLAVHTNVQYWFQAFKNRLTNFFTSINLDQINRDYNKLQIDLKKSNSFGKKLNYSSNEKEGILAKIIDKNLFQKRLFEILHFYSTSVCHPQAPSSVLKLEGWNFAHILLIFMPKRFQADFEFLLEAEIWLKNCQNFINDSQLLSSFFNSSDNINADTLYGRIAWINT